MADTEADVRVVEVETEEQMWELSVVTMTGATYTVLAKSGWSVFAVKQALQEIIKHAPHQQRLLLDSRILNNPELIVDILPARKGPHELFLVVCKDEQKADVIAKLMTRQTRLNDRGIEEHYREDFDVIQAAVKTDGMSLEYARGAPKKDRELNIAAIKQNGFALQYVAQELRQELRSDPEVVLMAVRSNAFSISLASPSLQNDVEFAIRATCRNAFVRDHLPSAVTTDRAYIQGMKKEEDRIAEMNEAMQRTSRTSRGKEDVQTEMAAPPSSAAALSAEVFDDKVPLQEEKQAERKTCSMCNIFRCLRS